MASVLVFQPEFEPAACVGSSTTAFSPARRRVSQQRGFVAPRVAASLGAAVAGATATATATVAWTQTCQAPTFAHVPRGRGRFDMGPLVARATEEPRDTLPADASQGGFFGRCRATLRDPSKRRRIASLGPAAALSYTFVKGIKLALLNFFACYIAAMRSGVAPTRCWPSVLSTYAALYIATVPIQPAKWVVVAALTPAADKLTKKTSEQLRVSGAQALALLLVAAVAFSVLLWALAILAASFVARMAL